MKMYLKNHQEDKECSLDTRPNLAPPTHFLVGKFGLALLH